MNILLLRPIAHRRRSAAAALRQRRRHRRGRRERRARDPHRARHRSQRRTRRVRPPATAPSAKRSNKHGSGACKALRVVAVSGCDRGLRRSSLVAVGLSPPTLWPWWDSAAAGAAVAGHSPPSATLSRKYEEGVTGSLACTRHAGPGPVTRVTVGAFILCYPLLDHVADCGEGPRADVRTQRRIPTMVMSLAAKVNKR
jgi:hypothetical protein